MNSIVQLAQPYALRQQPGRSQEDLAIAVDVDQSTLSKIEGLGPAAVGWTRLCRLAAALGYEAEVVLHPVGQPGAHASQESGTGKKR